MERANTTARVDLNWDDLSRKFSNFRLNFFDQDL